MSTDGDLPTDSQITAFTDDEMETIDLTQLLKHWNKMVQKVGLSYHLFYYFTIYTVILPRYFTYLLPPLPSHLNLM